MMFFLFDGDGVAIRAITLMFAGIIQQNSPMQPYSVLKSETLQHTQKWNMKIHNYIDIILKSLMLSTNNCLTRYQCSEPRQWLKPWVYWHIHVHVFEMIESTSRQRWTVIKDSGLAYTIWYSTVCLVLVALQTSLSVPLL